MTETDEKTYPKWADKNTERFQELNSFLSEGGHIISQYTATGDDAVKEQVFVLYKPDNAPTPSP
jgi:hypothetical protein